ncbi:MAG: SurA N-terminal domain-containing protein [Bacteroidetes bacterium]|nr:SurA N-terminal domain-containing protein [Bacteroidota bacterium]
MAVIGKIRSYSGLLIGIIGLALVAFVLQDFLGNSGPSRSGVSEIGKVSDNKISIHEFEQRYSEELDGYKRRKGSDNIEPHEAHMIRQQTWDRLVNDYLVDDQIESLGISVSKEELKDMFFGDEPHPFVMAAFTADPNTGQVDKAEMISILQSLDPGDPRLVRLEKEARKQRKIEKYNSLVSKGYYVPTFFAKQNFKETIVTLDLRYAMKRYSQIADSIVVVTDADMQAAYNEIKHIYDQEEMRDLEFVILPVFASEEDREKIFNEVLKLKEELESTDDRNVEPFVNTTSDRRFNPTFRTKGTLIPELEAIMFEAPQGTIYGPYMHENAFVVSMLNKIELRPDSMSASHILIAYRNAMMAEPTITRSYDEAKLKADSLVNIFKRGRADFAALASQLSDDPSAAVNKGDIGWFQDGMMVAPFTQAVIENSVGSFVVAETDFGFHVIKVTGKSQATKKIQLAEVVREIVPSSITYGKIYSQASDFALEVKKTKDFAKVAEEKGIAARSATKVKKMDNNIPGIATPREIVRWAFLEDVKVGSVSRIFEIDDRFVIATVSKVHDAGIPKLTEIEEPVRAHALNQKKFEYISAKIKEANSQSLQYIADLLANPVQDVFDLKYKASIIAGAGREPLVIGKVINNEIGSISEPIKGNSGIFVVEVIRRDEFSELPEYTSIQLDLKRNFNSRASRVLLEALKKNAKIEDHRDWFY